MRKRNPSDVRNERRDALTAVADKFKSFRPAREVLRRVRAVPTIFPQFDHAVRVGGYPLERFTLVHGPSNHGKTIYVIGLVRSFLQRDHLAVFIDAERTTPLTWVEKLMGDELVDHPGFFAERPETYEQTISKVRSFLMTTCELREQGEIAEDTAAIIIVDSLRKLVPADLMKEILASKEDIKAGKDRSAQLRAKMNAAWMDELTPLLEKAQASFVAIAREMEDPDADAWSRKFGNNYKVGGGAAIVYDASLVQRVERAGWVTEGEGADRKVYGERHRVTIKKTKVAGKDDKTSIAYFHTSNGTLIREGFDCARDVIELGIRFGVVEQKGSSISYRGERIGQGTHRAVKALSERPDWLALIEQEVRGQFDTQEPIEHDTDGVVA